MIIYADITFINNFLMTLAIIWAVGQILEYRLCWWRLILAALIGTAYTFVIIFIQLAGRPLFISCLLHMFLNILTSLVMVKIAFKVKKKRFLKGVAYLYLITFITIGTTLSIIYIYGGTPFDNRSQLFFIISLGIPILLLFGNYGWRLFQKYVSPEAFYLPVKIVYNEKERELTGLIDTGNNLIDPFTRVPVIVVSLTDITPLFNAELGDKLHNFKGDDLELVEFLNNYGLGSRIRVLPFSGLGQESGILVGFRPDKIIIFYGEQLIETEKIIIALSRQKLDEEDEFQALIHPQIIKLQL